MQPLVQERDMKRQLLLCLLPCAALSLTACTQFPELDRTQTPELADTAYPALVPIEPLLAGAEVTGADPVATTEALEGRVAGLRARANRMRGAVLTDAERRRLQEGVR